MKNIEKTLKNNVFSIYDKVKERKGNADEAMSIWKMEKFILMSLSPLNE